MRWIGVYFVFFLALLVMTSFLYFPFERWDEVDAQVCVWFVLDEGGELHVLGT